MAKDSRVVGTAGDNNVEDAQANFDAAKKSGDQEFITAATNRLANTKKRVAKGLAPRVGPPAPQSGNQPQAPAPSAPAAPAPSAPAAPAPSSKKDPRVVGTAGDNSVEDAQANLDAAKKSGDQEFITAATNRLANTKKRVELGLKPRVGPPEPGGGEQAPAPSSKEDPRAVGTAGDSNVEDAQANLDAAKKSGDEEFIAAATNRLANTKKRAAKGVQQVGPPIPGQVAGPGGAEGASGEAPGGGKWDANGNVVDPETGVGVQPGGVPKQQVPGVNQKPEYTLDRGMSLAELKDSPTGIYNMPGGQVERDIDGAVRVRSISAEGQARLARMKSNLEKDLGDWSGKEDQNAPRPPVIPGMPAFNPDTGRWIGIEEDSILEEFG